MLVPAYEKPPSNYYLIYIRDNPLSKLIFFLCTHQGMVEGKASEEMEEGVEEKLNSD